MNFIYTKEQIQSIMDNLDKLNIKGLDNIQIVLQIISILNQPKQKDFPMHSVVEEEGEKKEEKEK